MKVPSRKAVLVLTLGIALTSGRACLPSLLTWLTNAILRKIPGLRGNVRGIAISFMRPGLAAEGISVTMLNGGSPGYRIEADRLSLSSDWKSLLSGALVASLHIDAPRVLLHADEIHHAHGDDGNIQGQSPARDGDETNKPDYRSGAAWQQQLTQLPRFKVASVILSNGEIRVVGVPGENGGELSISGVNVRAENITNSIELAPTTMARLSADARILDSGKMQLQAQGYPLAAQPTFNVDLTSSDIDLRALRKIIEAAIEINVLHGIAGLYVEAAAADGYISGYAKPIFDHLELAPPAQSGFWARLRAAAAKVLAWLIKNKRKDRIATRLDFEGAIGDPDLDITDAILRFVRNAFSTAERASLEHRIGFLRAGKTPDEVIIRDQSEPRSRISAFFALSKETFSRWSGDGAPRLAAALSYYTTFSMAPLLIIAISIAGLVLGHAAAEGRIIHQIGGLVGTKSAAAIEDMLKGAAGRTSKGIFGSIIGIVTLIIGATAVLSELKNALNTIWRTREPDNIKELIEKNSLLVGMVLGIGFLVTVSLLLSAAVATLGESLNGYLPIPEFILYAIDFVISAGITAVLFAAMYRFLPNTMVEWRDVWIGAVVTSLLFNIGKIGLGLYIGKSAVASSYGAAGSILVLLLWIYYSGLIFYFGAEFTKCYADRYGSRLRNKPVKKGAVDRRRT
jgi:membrane protein